MAKKKQTKSKPKSKRVSSHPFMETRRGDLADLLAAARKGPQRDQAGSRFVTPSVGSDKPGSREG